MPYFPIGNLNTIITSKEMYNYIFKYIITISIYSIPENNKK